MDAPGWRLPLYATTGCAAIDDGMRVGRLPRRPRRRQTRVRRAAAVASRVRRPRGNTCDETAAAADKMRRRQQILALGGRRRLLAGMGAISPYFQPLTTEERIVLFSSQHPRID
ncbi:Os04g0552950 [Oryza sativa Japonica Group]|uniref:Os04g0552950 protein n=1 Tax=Oryza sativa subsp. japonica TaxID=39947 RepID=A0A0P0WDM0_ORYSJ|nr:Os04g0552950 [Oryza sativa Japonica Group]